MALKREAISNYPIEAPVMTLVRHRFPQAASAVYEKPRLWVAQWCIFPRKN